MSQSYNAAKSLPRLYTLEAYLDREAKAAHKSSYHNGNIIKMAGAKARHNEICANALTSLKIAAKTLKSIYRTYTSDQKIYIEQENTIVYPDALVVCSEPEFWDNRQDLITNPLLIVEVLSKSTKQHDKGSKFMLYKNLPSFAEYVLVEQDECKVEVWTKTGKNKWEFVIHTDLSDHILLQSMENINVSVADIYENIIF
jgi:Uma2 family endonuclease